MPVYAAACGCACAAPVLHQDVVAPGEIWHGLRCCRHQLRHYGLSSEAEGLYHQYVQQLHTEPSAPGDQLLELLGQTNNICGGMAGHPQLAYASVSLPLQAWQCYLILLPF